MAVPSWLSLTFTIADFIVQRVDRVGPVELEASSDQPPERAQAVMDADVEPPEMDTSLDEAPPAEVDSPQSDSSFGFHAARAGGGGTPSGGGGGSGGNDDDDNGDGDNGDGDGDEQLENSLDRGGTSDPEPPEQGGEIETDDDDDNGDGGEQHARRNEVRCSFRAMRPHDQPTRYDVDRGGDEV